MQALFDTMERLYDPECEFHYEGDADFVPMIMDGAFFEFINVTVFALGIAGALGTTSAVKYTINQITSGSGMYDLNHPDKMEQHLGVIWLTFTVVLAITTVITAYFARLMLAAKTARKTLFERMKIDDNMATPV